MIEFYGYKHWTLESVSRCFYVGKGNIKRPFQKSGRNHKWHAIVKRFGLRVEICVGPVTNEEACAWEIEQIVVMKTFSTNHSHDELNDVACNFTCGGDGISGWHHRDDTRIKMKRSHTGTHLSEETKNAIRNAHKGKIKTEDHRKKLSDSNLGKNNGKFAGEKHHATKLTDDRVVEIRRQWLTMTVTRKQLCTQHDVNANVLNCVLSGRTFGHLLVEGELVKLARMKRWR